MHTQGFARKCTTVACTLALVLNGAFAYTPAFADNASEKTELQRQANEMTQKIEDATASYEEATAQVETLQQMISENEARSAEIEEQLPAQRERTATSVKAMYLLQQSAPNLLGLILSAESFNDFITTMSYIDNIHERNANEINTLTSMTNELQDTRSELTLEYEAAEQLESEALNALEEARAAKKDLQERANAIAAAEEKERAEAIAKAQQAIEAAKQQPASGSAEQQKADEAKQEQANQQEQQEQKQEEQKQEEQASQEENTGEATFTTASGNTAQVEVPEEEATTSASTEPITNNTTSDETSGWAARIDAYLAGSPLAGYGATFAAAAAQYGADPRLSPAISCIESGKGQICFLPHNAWGWGSSSWSNWEEAIYAHVKGLASLYGGTLTIEGAQMYCPPTYQEWYSSVLSEMNSI